jgi:serine/threonine protein kinase
MIGPFSTGTMPLNPGTRLGVYQVTAKIGEGGMGEVYQARDTKLDRDVALKVLPEAFTSDPDRLARFEREAKVLASLNHPNIGSIYGVEEADGVKALVLELIEGPTLADRIKLGPIPVDEALPIARQIAEALGAAHEAGVIHRDLKPANIKVREDGTVKVLDFGLAKALDPSPVEPFRRSVMKMLMHVRFPVGPFNAAVRDGSAGPKIQRILEAIKPEAAYFTSAKGRRGGTLVVNLSEPSDIPALAEPFFLTFDAEVELEPFMTAEDLASGGLDALGADWG